jgi:acid stress chaperone HdeB
MRTALALLFALTLSSIASAEMIDLSTQTCRQFQTSSKEDIGIILTWLDGYYKDENDPPIIDTAKFEANAKKLGEFCAQNPTVGLITATDKLFGK